MSKLRILLADDHAILRDGLAALINAQADMAVIAQAATGREAVRLALDDKPDVAVLDISMPDMGGAEAAEEIRGRCPAVRVLALTRHADPAYLRRMLQAGATGYMLKKSAADALINALRIVARGGTYIEPALAGAVLRRAYGRNGEGNGVPDGESLSGREEEVLRRLAWGRSNKEIAAELGISVKTVESYKATATDKLGLRSRAQIVRYGVAHGWLSDEAAPE
jgi:two-component system, NarL family, response regulator NreC